MVFDLTAWSSYASPVPPTGIFKNHENKGKFDELRLTSKTSNCANRDAMAQLKMKWRKFGGAV
jgi:hypothetical protein